MGGRLSRLVWLAKPLAGLAGLISGSARLQLNLAWLTAQAGSEPELRQH